MCGDTPVVRERKPPALRARKEGGKGSCSTTTTKNPQQPNPTQPNPNPSPNLCNRTADSASAVTRSPPRASQPAHRRGAAPPAPPRLRRVRGCAGASAAERPPRPWEPSGVPRGDRDPAAGIQPEPRVNRMGCFVKTEPVCIAQVELTLLPECFCFRIHILPSVADITVL